MTAYQPIEFCGSGRGCGECAADRSQEQCTRGYFYVICVSFICKPFNRKRQKCVLRGWTRCRTAVSSAERSARCWPASVVNSPEPLPFQAIFMSNALPDRVRLGVFEVDLRVGELRHGERKSILTEQPLRILRMLVEGDGDLVAREAIRKALWPNDTIVEFDHSINAATRKLRLALGDSPDEPKYIETIPRRGYRLLVAVERLETSKDDATGSDEPGNSEPENQPHVPPPSPDSVNGNLIGKKVSHYRVLEVLGGGGMGMLYKAEDLKLGRQVALKFLPEEMAWDTLALQRFEREARTASSLDHPNICTIYEVEEHAGQPFIVMQLLQGQTLRDRLAALAAQHNKLPLNELLGIAVQICDGLEAAHAKGIVHRDIKPANIFLTTAGQVKILDFGLAKLVSTTHEDGSDGLELELDGTAAQPARSVLPDATLTRLGVAMGTAGYMSPEQVRGEKLDSRTDIFSFGLVLYEMATGQRAFTGETAAIVHNAILNDASVPATQLNPEIPRELGAIIDKALEKDREQRYQTVVELRSELEGVEIETSFPHTTAPGAAKPRHRRSLRLVLSVVGVLTIVALLGVGIRRMFLRPQLVQQRLTSNATGNRVTAAAISPDGKYLAYHDQTGLYLRSIATGETHVVGLPGALPGGFYTALFWLPVGGKLLVDIDGKGLWLVAISGNEQPRLLYEMGTDPAIAPDGRTIAFIRRTYESGNEGRHQLWVGNVDGETPRQIVNAQETDQMSAPVWSPDGKWITYCRTWKAAQEPQHSAIEVSPAGGGPGKTLLTESSIPESNSFSWYAATWLPDGRLVFVATRSSRSEIEGSLWQGSLWQVRVDPGTAQIVGQPERLTQWDNSCCGNLTSTRDGKTLAFVKYQAWVDEYLGELNADATTMKTPRSILRTGLNNGSVSSWAHDGRFMLVDSMRNGHREIYQQRPDGTTAETLVAGSRDVCCAQITPDGARLLYLEYGPVRVGENPNSFSLMRRSVTGSPAEKVLEGLAAEFDALSCKYNPKADPPCVLAMSEGENLVFYSLDPIKGKGRQLGKIDVMGFGSMRGWDLSPDGSRVAVVSLHKKTAQIDVGTQIEYGGRIDVLTLSDGNWHRILAEPTDQAASAGNQQLMRFCQIAWAADGKSFFITAMKGDSFNLVQVTSDGKMHVLLGSESYQNQFLVGPLPSPDGKFLAFSSTSWDGNAWIIDNLR